MTRTTELVESLQAQMRGGTNCSYRGASNYPFVQVYFNRSLADGTVTLQQRITELTKRMQAKEKQTREAQQKTREAEQAAADRDKQLAEIITRVRKYEQACVILLSDT